MRIVSIEHRSSTNNSWGFGGARNIRIITMENGDVWRTGIAGSRHMGETKYIRSYHLRGRDDDGFMKEVDVVLRGKAETWLAKYYAK